MAEKRYTYWVLWGKLEERDHFGDLGIDGRPTLKWISQK
jgi:hypothetical protein